MPRRRARFENRSALALLVALTGHGAIALAVAQVDSLVLGRSHARPPRAVAAREEPSIELEEVTAPAATTNGSTSAALATSLGARTARDHAPRRAFHGEAGAPTATDGAGASSGEPSARDTTGWSFDPLAPKAGAARIGLGDRGVPPPSARNEAAPDVAGDADARDAQRGFGRAGVLSEVVVAAARHADAPDVGFAHFEITLGGSAGPTVRLLDETSDYAGWKRILSRVVDGATERASAVRMPPDGRALRVVVRVEASHRLPNGRDERTLGARVTGTGLALDEKAPPGQSKLVLPSKTLHLTGKVCGLSVTLGVTASPIAGGCDLDAIGSRFARQVKARVVAEERVTL